MRRERYEVTVGMFVVVGLFIFTLVLLAISGAQFLRKGYSLNVMYQYVSILDKGAPVRMAGVRIGEVQQVLLIHDEEKGQTRVRVKLFIEKGIEIRENYMFFIRGTHILSEPHIEVSPFPGNWPILQPDATVDGVDPTPMEALIQRAHTIASDIEQVFGTLKEAVVDQESQEAVKNILLNLAKLSESLRVILSGSEEDFKEALGNIKNSSEVLTDILEHAREGEGSVGKLLMEDELYQEMREFVAEIKAHPWKLLRKESQRKKFLGIF